MTKRVFIGFIFIIICFSAFAGDVAVFVDSGFSKDGNVYIFGQYGKTDRTFEAYAEIYIVDVAGNKFTPDGIYKTLPSPATANRNGKEVYEKLEAQHYLQLKQYTCSKVNADNILYLSGDDTKPSSEEISFKDFAGSTIEKPVSYHVALMQTISGSGEQAKSSFYISVKKQAEDGNIICEYKVGSPQTKRSGVTGYKINRIFRDDTGKKMIFVIEKTVEDKTGTCIRYMVETVKL